MRLITVLVASALALTACNSVTKEALPTSADDPKLAEIGKRLDDEQKKLLLGYLMRREMAKAFGGQELADGAGTVGDAIEAQRKWAANLTESQQKAEALKAEVEQKRKALAEQIGKTVTVAFINAEFHPSSFETERYEDYESLSFAVQNLGAKSIKALKGEAVFIDTFGDVFVRVPMQFEESIDPGEKKIVELGMEINKFMDNDKKVMQIDGSKKFRFEPEQIVFADGSTIKAPQQAD
ncbi:hypothetical protein [Sphingomonas sp. ID0503]|uniref:hypothetical protein n=1 Tax=Sphingomonas sp. ID0503 TaxID=3399691 RepID=UPI003AFA90D4